MKHIKAIAAIVSVSSFLIYQYMLVTKKVDISELYFISLSLSVAAFAFLSLRKGDTIFDNSLVVLCGTFFCVIVIIYVYRWVLFGDGSTNYYTAACISAILTFIYTICYVIFRSKPIFKHK